METFELAPDDQKSIESYQTLELAIGRARALLYSRHDVQRFHIYATTSLGRGLVGTVSREGYRPATRR